MGSAIPSTGGGGMSRDGAAMTLMADCGWVKGIAMLTDLMKSVGELEGQEVYLQPAQAGPAERTRVR